MNEEAITGKLDRCISEMIWLSEHPKDEITIQTIKHHAEDMILAGKDILQTLGYKMEISGTYNNQLNMKEKK